MKKSPNILVILCDDLGYGDLTCYGDAELKTPNIDRLAREGVRLTSYYAAAANCSPARTGFMTGRTPTRVGVHNWIPMFSPVHVRRQEITVATLLRNAGYDTGHFGKWHLNGDFNLPSQPQPWDHGFNDWFSTQNNALPNHRNQTACGTTAPCLLGGAGRESRLARLGMAPVRVTTNRMAELSTAPHNESEKSLTAIPQLACLHPRHVVRPQLT